VVIGAVIWAILAAGQASLDKPITEWSDEELVRRLPKYMNLLTAQVQANEWEKNQGHEGKD
jgi:hypothetical protein